jgi:hypothetical protein
MPSADFEISQIFTPNDTPTVTYVERDDLRLEEKLKTAVKLPKMVVSVSGPSKSGKTVLIKKVVEEDLIIPVIGAGIASPEDLWTRALQSMGTGTTTSTTTTTGTHLSGGVKGGGEVGIPLIAKGKADAHLDASKSWGNSSTTTMVSAGLTRVIKEISDSDFVIFIDDFHYIREDLREEIGRQIKVAADNGVKIITASVPHRADDVVRSNTELRGRVSAIDIGYWNSRHLKMIASQGFNSLKVNLKEDIINRLSNEAMGSPQLMQTICFCLCQVLAITKPFKNFENIEVHEGQLSAALSQTSSFTDFSKMLSSLHAGPKTRGQERKEHQFFDHTRGDVYRAVLLAIRKDPILMSFTYDELLARIKAVCIGEPPSGSSVNSCLEQMNSITEEIQPGRPVLAWDGTNLDITDPYFAFFLRCSDKIIAMGRPSDDGPAPNSTENLA